MNWGAASMEEPVGMRSQGQYCPIARASELLAERWSIIILRNIVFLGCLAFSEIADGAPGLSRVGCRSGCGSWSGLGDREWLPRRRVSVRLTTPRCRGPAAAAGLWRWESSYRGRAASSGRLQSIVSGPRPTRHTRPCSIPLSPCRHYY
ncbi:MAG: helix-turn-helix, HxlR type [Propionibacteriaceae bacterium]|nr:helix-turn-helix, HxlR type [Propionibacteriaceae bacterium]